MENSMSKTESDYKMKSITLPSDIAKKLADEAKKNKRSFSGEIAYRIEKSLEKQENSLTV